MKRTKSEPVCDLCDLEEQLSQYRYRVQQLEAKVANLAMKLARSQDSERRAFLRLLRKESDA